MDFDPFVYRAATTEMLRRLNAKAWAAELNRAIAWEYFDLLQPDGRHMVKVIMEHAWRHGQPHRRHLRCAVASLRVDTGELEWVLLDIYPEDFTALPTREKMMALDQVED